MFKEKLVVMVSSTVYGIKVLLNHAHALLTAFGCEMWMSHKGTVQIFLNRSTLDVCLEAVCDLSRRNKVWAPVH